MADDEMVFERPDDPYRVTMRRDAEGNVHFVVSADVMPNATDTEAVRAEVQRRADLIRSWMQDFLRPGQNHRPTSSAPNDGDPS